MESDRGTPHNWEKMLGETVKRHIFSVFIDFCIIIVFYFRRCNTFNKYFTPFFGGGDISLELAGLINMYNEC